MIYFDSAATTLQKPPQVARTMAGAVTTLASPGRGGHIPAMKAAETAYRCRSLAGQLLGVSEPERVVFTFNATHALNIAIASLVSSGDKVVISGYEHNAVTRPLHALKAEVLVAAGPVYDSGSTLAAFQRLITPDVKCVICTQVSNVFGFIMPVDPIAMLCRRWDVPLIVDASQSAGCLPVRCDDWNAAFVAMPGHKGLYGPQGTGLLLCGDGVPVVPLLQGGTGSNSLTQEMPEFLPDRLEAGTHNIAGIAALAEGLNFVLHKTPAVILKHEQRLLRRLAQGMDQIPGVESFYDLEGTGQSGVMSFRMKHRDCEEIAAWLGQRNVAVRAGLHCAPLAHETAGTVDTGTVRVSFSAFNTLSEVEAFLRLVDELARKR